MRTILLVLCVLLARSALAQETPYSHAVRKDRPCGYWRLNDPVAGTIVAATVGPNGTRASGVVANVAGADGTAFQFPDTGAVEIPDQPDWALTGNFSIEFWTRTDDGSTKPMGYIGHNEGATHKNKWAIFQNYANQVGKIAFHMNGSTTANNNGEERFWTFDPKGAKFSHVVLSRKGNRWALHVNGQLRGVHTWSVTLPDVAAKLMLGTPGEPSFQLNGYLDEVAIYCKRALPPKAIRWHYKAAQQSQ